MLISEDTSKALDVLVGAFFDLNRTTDRMISIMQNEFTMPNAVSIIHPKIAHLYPLFADKVTEIKDNYNMTSIYPETHEDSRTYNNLSDMFNTLLSQNEDVYKMIQMADSIAVEKGDINVHADLITLVQKFNILFGQIMTLRDKAEQMPTDYDNFDRHISSWGINGVEL